MSLLQADALRIPLADASVHMCVTSPPYWNLRDYSTPGQLGLEATPEEYVENMVNVFREVWRVLRPDSTCWVNLGDSYASGEVGRHDALQDRRGPDGKKPYAARGMQTQRQQAKLNSGLKQKDLVGIPWRVAFALQADGWYLRSDIVWAKENPMPESVQGSHFSRHRVTIAEYERLSHLRETQGQDQDRTSHLSSLSAGEVSDGQAPLSEKPEGTGNGASKGAARRRNGKAAAVQPITTGEAQQSQVRSNGKGTSYAEEGASQVLLQREGKANGSRPPSKNEELTSADSAEASGQRPLSGQREVEGEEAPRLRQAQGGDSANTASDSRGLVGDRGATQELLPLLRQAEGIDTRPCDPIEQGGIACEGEHSASLSELQLEEEGSADPVGLVDCPGCAKCERSGGYISHLSAGRPTKSHEYLFLLTKSPEYYYDNVAIAEPTADGTGTRNKRDVWTINTEPYSQAHFATFPTALVEPCILAGTSARGCCATCGAPWERVTEREQFGKAYSATKYDNTQQAGPLSRSRQAYRAAGLEGPPPVVTTGWRPTCAHADAPTVPATVLDPFAGSGTTGQVARLHGRRFVGLDINGVYLRELALPRAEGRSTQASLETLPLFAAAGAGLLAVDRR